MRRTILITRAPVDIWLCVVLLLSEYPRAPESKPRAPCWLILDGLSDFASQLAPLGYVETVLARPIQFSKNRPGPEQGPGHLPTEAAALASSGGGSQTRTRPAWQALTSHVSAEFRGTF